MKNPFAPSVYQPGSITVPSIHQAALQRLRQSIEDLKDVPFNAPQPGTSLLLTAPRAGFGKSHLLTRLADSAAGNFLTISLPLAPGESWDWRELTLTLADRLAHTATTTPFCALDETAWFAFSQLVKTGLTQGKVSSENPSSSLQKLNNEFREVFSPEAPENHSKWFVGTSRSLFASCGTTLASSAGCDATALQSWFRRFLSFAYPGPRHQPQRWQRLRSALSEASGTGQTWKRRFQTLARLASGARPIVWVADDLDRFFADPHGARQLMAGFAEMLELVPRSLLIVAANQDLWTQVFLPGTPSALIDRLTAREVVLPPISAGQAEELIAARTGAAEFRDEEARRRVYRLDFHQGAAPRPLTPRSALRWAAHTWEASPPVPEPEPMAIPAPAPDPVTPEPESRTVLRAREQLHALAEALRLQSGPPAALQSATPIPEPEPLPSEPVTLPSTASLAERFQSLRLAQFAHGTPALDLKRIHRLISAIGERFPSIQQRGWDPEPGLNGEALGWQAAGREILIGFAPPTSYRFWRQLVAEAQRDGLREHPRKVVVLIPAGQSVPLERFAGEPSQANVFIDVVAVDAELAASLQAAEELLQAARRGVFRTEESKLNSFLAKELDYFWRRLTRFPKVGAGRPAEAVQPV